MVAAINDRTRARIFEILAEVKDPEIPVISIFDLGILRDVIPGNPTRIVITPTYSGCPATDVIALQIRMTLLEAGIRDFTIEQRLSPAWTTNWITQNGLAQLKAYGISPPVRGGNLTELENFSAECPQCGSRDTRLISEFGSTACKALFQCNACKEPFDYFKCH